MITPRPEGCGAGKPDNRKARIKQLKKTLREIDSPAVEAGWWSLVLEQVDDGVLG